MALSDYGFVGNDIIPNTPIEKVITGFFLAINKVYRGVFQHDNSDILDFLGSINYRNFIIGSSGDYLRVGERAMFRDSYYSQNNVFKRFCYLNETTGEFILFDKNNDNAKLLERNTILQDAVAQLIDSGFQTSILPFYYWNSGYLTAVEFETFYRVFAYPFFKDYFIQRLKYLSLLRVYTEYRDSYLSSAFIYERSSQAQSSDNDVFLAYNNIQFLYGKGGLLNSLFIDIEVKRYSNHPNDKHFYIEGIVKNIYILKSYIDSHILTYNDDLIYNKSGVFQSTTYSGVHSLLDDDGHVLNGLWTRLDLSTVYSITYKSDNGTVTADCYKVDYGFNIENYIQEQLNRLNAVDVTDMYSDVTYYCEWGFTDSNSRLTTISDCFDFSDI